MHGPRRWLHWLVGRLSAVADLGTSGSSESEDRRVRVLNLAVFTGFIFNGGWTVVLLWLAVQGRLGGLILVLGSNVVCEAGYAGVLYLNARGRRAGARWLAVLTTALNLGVAGFAFGLATGVWLYLLLLPVVGALHVPPTHRVELAAAIGGGSVLFAAVAVARREVPAAIAEGPIGPIAMGSSALFMALTAAGLALYYQAVTERAEKASEGLLAELSQVVATVERQREELARFLPQQVAELMSSPEGLRLLEAHRSEITVVFADIRGFTSFTASAEPEEVISVLGDYHRTMGGLVTAFGGTLGGFEGDGLMVFFNDPIPECDHAGKAVEMARGMQAAFTPLAHEWQRRGFCLGLGIGVATGYATLGRIGYEGRYDYTPIGTPVNLASRLCDLADTGEILASQRTIAASGVASMPLPDPLVLKGLPHPVPIHRV